MADVPGGSHHIHPSAWGNPRAERALSRLNGLAVPEVSARTMRRRLRGIPATLPPDPVPSPGGKRPAPDPLLADPRDWRWVVGGIGRVLISIGLLIFAFVAYQLWGTGIQYARAQDVLEAEFTEQLAQYPGAPSTVGAVTTLPQIPAVEDTGASADPTTTAAVTTPPPADPAADPLTLGLGDLLGRIEIPAIGVDDYIVAGVRATDLAKGVGHYPYTPLPGSTGNSAIAGHRTTHGQPFFELDQLVNGDEIVVTTVQGRFVYSVTGSTVVEPTDFTVLYGTPDESVLTLTTCHPRWSTKKRLVISAVLVPDETVEGAAVIEYTPEAVEESETAATIPGDDTQVVDQPGDLPAAATVDAFSNGWFSDPAAWPQIALWGTALTALALFATWVGNRTRKWLSALLFISPFVVLLYFWFENVNRLLPPNL